MCTSKKSLHSYCDQIYTILILNVGHLVGQMKHFPNMARLFPLIFLDNDQIELKLDSFTTFLADDATISTTSLILSSKLHLQFALLNCHFLFF